ncbi:MAG: 5'/3'-nucleotidase SurE [Lachnospiraceae bacterium]|nr:5'/3'-nucleotidase SurE [Lachnospiraceae bacterium]
MRILITNDDGIKAEGLRLLTEAAASLKEHELWIVAPAEQCSAMSQRITLREELFLKEEDFPVPVHRAFSLSGTPADCVKVAFSHIMKDKAPDCVFSGMNFGYNSGFDIAYSGTVGAAMEGILQGVPSFAFSNEAYVSNELAIKMLPELMRELLKKPVDLSGIWNVNIPGCPPEECRGILWDRKPATIQFYADHYDARDMAEGQWLKCNGIPTEQRMEEGTDIAALQDKYVSIGRVKCMIFA